MIIILFPFFLFATDYYISFQYTIKNNQVINEKLEYSKCMIQKKLPTIKLMKYFYKHNNLKDIFKYEQEEIIDMLSKNGIILHNTNKIVNFNPNDKIKITYLPKRFDIIFKDGYMIFKLKGQK